MKIFPPAILLTAFVTPLTPQWHRHRTPAIPRTADGKPDLTGLWSLVTKVGDLKPAEVQPWAQALVQQRAENFGKDSPRYHRCRSIIPSYRSWVWLVWLALLLLPPRAQCTIIALVIEDHSISVAADGRRSIFNESAPDAMTPYCKIRETSGFLFVAAGIYQDVDVGFDLWKIAAVSAEKAANAESAMENLKGLIADKIATIVAHGRARFPAMYKTWQNGTPIVSAAFGEVKPNVRLLTCDFLIGADDNPVPVICHSREHTEPITLVSLGSYEEAFANVRKDAAAEDFAERNPIGFLTKIIQFEIDAHKAQGKNDIGPPIASAIFDRLGLHWVAEGACADHQ